MSLKRITKHKVKSIIKNEGAIICRVLPCNANPNSPWFRDINAQLFTSIEEFTKYVNQYEYYNCNDEELGRYCSFYVNVNLYK